MDEKLYHYDSLAINTIVKNNQGGISSCDISFHNKSNEFETEYLKYIREVATNTMDRNIDDHMVIGTLAMIETKIDSVIE